MCLVYGLLFLIWHPVVMFRFEGHGELAMWCHGLIFMLRWPLVLLGVFLSATTLTLNIRLRRRIDRTPSVALSYTEASMRRSWPIGLLPIAGILLLLGDLLPVGFSAHAIYFIPALVVSLMLMSRVEDFLELPVRYKGHEWSGLIFIASTLLYASLGVVLALYSDPDSGEHVGDEGHYLTQAESLYQDKDLDIKNNFLSKHDKFGRDYDDQKAVLDGKHALTPEEELAHRSQIHVSTRSRDGHWYSFHPYGLSLLIAPSYALGDGLAALIVRYLILGLIGALGNVAMYKLARELGVERNASLVVISGFALSIYWAIYSARALPEVLGATLLLWLFWAVLAQARQPWFAVRLGALCVTYLPMAHDRFLAPALMGFGFFGLFGLMGKEKVGAKLMRLSVFTLLCAAGLACYWVIQCYLYDGGLKYDPQVMTRDILFGYPLGMWGIIADWRGVMPMLPLFMWLAAGWLGWWVTVRFGRDARNFLHADFALAVLITFLVCLVTSCCNGSYVGGKCLPGRYILIAIPLLVPGAAVMFERSSITCRWWYLFLSLLSTTILVMVLIWLPEIGRGFIFPITNLRILHPVLDGLFNPYVNFLYPYEGVGTLQHWATAYVVTGIVLTFAAMFMSRLRLAGPLLCGIIFLVGMASHEVQLSVPTTPEGFTKIAGEDGQFARHMSRVSMNGVYFRGAVTNVPALLDFAHLTFRDFKVAKDKIGITTKDLGQRTKGNVISQPNLETNDWAGRNLAWTTLTAPHHPSRGNHLLHIRATVEGDVTPYLAIREGSHDVFSEQALPVVDGVLDQIVLFNCTGWRGDLYMLMRLGDGKGNIRLETLEWLPHNNSMVAGTGLDLPPNTLSAAK